MYVCSNITTNRKKYGKAEEGTEKVPSTKYSSFFTPQSKDNPSLLPANPDAQ